MHPIFASRVGVGALAAGCKSSLEVLNEAMNLQDLRNHNQPDLFGWGAILGETCLWSRLVLVYH